MADLLAEPPGPLGESPSATGMHAPPLPTELPPDVPALTEESSDKHEALERDREVVRETFKLDDIDSHKGMTPPPRPVTQAPDTAETPALPPDEDIFEVNAAAEGSGAFSGSGVDLQQLDSGSFENIVEEVVGEAGPKTRSSSGIDLGSAELPRLPADQPPSETEPPSGRDLIAEAVESGVDLKQPLMDVVEEEAMEAGEVVESDEHPKPPATEPAEEEALEASEVVESSGTMQAPTMEIVEEASLEAGEVIESDADMKQPLMEMAEEQAKLDESGEEEALEAGEVVEDEPTSSSVNLGAPAETQQLTREQMDELAAGRELGAAAEDSAAPRSEEEPDARKTKLSGRGPIRATQMGDISDMIDAAPPEEAGELVEEEVVSGEAADAGEVIEETAGTESAGPVEREVAAPETVGADEEEIVISEDTPTVDSSKRLEEIASAGTESGVDIDRLLSEASSKSGADSGVLIDKLDKKEKDEIDPEEVELGVSAPPEDDSGAALRRAGGGEELEEEPAAAEEKRAKPEKPPKPRSPVLPFAGGGVAGTLLGAGLCVGVLYFAGMLGGGTKPTTPTNPSNQQKPPTAGPAPVTFEDRVAHLRGGDFAKVEPDKIEGKTPAELATRGEARWLTYLQKQGNAPAKKDDEQLKQAIDDLTKASQDANDKTSAANALYNLAQIDEMAGDVTGALKTYKEGAARFKDDPKLKLMFDGAVDRLESRTSQPGGMSRLPDPRRTEQPLILTVLVLLQPPMPAETLPDEEAGYKFWQAVKAARGQNYADALKALDAARALHDKRRFTQLRKPQNPLSDPTEEIFLRACDELKVYWTVQEKLKSSGYLTADQKDTAAAVDKLVTGRKTAETTITDLNKKLVDQKTVDDKTITDLKKDIADQKAAADKTIADLNKQLTDQKKASDTAVAAAKADAAKEAMRAKAAEDVIARIRGELVTAKLVDDKADGAKLVQAVKDQISAAKASDPMGKIRELQGELNATKAALAERRTPAETLPLWLPALEDRSKPLADAAIKDAERVLTDPKATPAQKAQAKAVMGLVFRNEEKFADAKNSLEEAKRGAGDDNALKARIDAALKEVSDPTAAYVARVESLRAKGDYDGAVNALTKVIEALPAEKRGELLAERSLLRLEAARAQAKEPLQSNNPMVGLAHQDAKAAAEAGAKAAGFYAEGRVAESLGNWPAAVASYRAAVGAHEALDAQGSRYRVALARALMQSQGKPAAPKEPAADTSDRRPPDFRGEVGALGAAPDAAAEARQALALLLVVALQPPPLPPASVEEAQKLADEVIQQEERKPGSVPFDVLAQAKAVKGLHTEALKIYAAGLRTKLPPEYAAGLMELIESHPKLRGADTLRVPNPLTAEKHYGAGLRWYYDRNYANAEKEFAEAVKNDALDARFHYFLGLSRLAQNKPEAAEDFAAGAKLEAQGRPPRGAVSAALERVQGPMRTALNEARNQPK
jgi:tetratricopeptide (TPR) repeat protein